MLTTLVWRALRRRAQAWTAQTRARTLFALRILPATCALVTVGLFLLPAYIAFEPRESNESVSMKLAVCALISVLGIALAIRRGLAAWLATRRLVNVWLSRAEPVRLPGVSIPAFRIRDPFPVIAIVGAFRPRLFLAGQIFDSLEEEEMVAACAHECAHIDARDNLKRTLLRACRDALSIIPCGRSLDNAWAQESEYAADERAAGTGTNSALDLAGARVKIARLAPVDLHPVMLPKGSYMISETADGVSGRVRRLVELASARATVETHNASTPLVNRLLWTCLCALLAALALAATNREVLETTHEAIERLVFLLK